MAPPPPDPKGPSLAPTALESATDHQEGMFHGVPSPKHTHNPERAGALRAAGRALCAAWVRRGLPCPPSAAQRGCQARGQGPARWGLEGGSSGPKGSPQHVPWRTVSVLVSPGAPQEPDAWHLTLCTACPGLSTAPRGSGGSLRAPHPCTKTPPPQPPAGQLLGHLLGPRPEQVLALPQGQSVPCRARLPTR